MRFHSKQSKAATEVENRVDKIDNLTFFHPQENINSFDYPLTPYRSKM